MVGTGPEEPPFCSAFCQLPYFNVFGQSKAGRAGLVEKSGDLALPSVILCVG